MEATMASVYKRNGGRNYWISWIDESGKRRSRSSKTSDKRAAERIAAKLESDAQLRKDGVIDARLDRIARELRRPLSEHFADYRKACEQSGQADNTIATKIRYLKTVAVSSDAGTFADLTLEGVSLAIDQLTARHRNGLNAQGEQVWRTEPASARSRNSARAAILAFSNWMKKSGRAERHPFNHLPKADELKDRRRVRRSLTTEELSRLLSVARERDAELNADPSYPHGKSTRAAWYVAAALAGLRRGDLVHLHWGDVEFEGGYITVREGKARREDQIPLHPQLAAELRNIRPDIVGSGTKVFPKAVTNRTRALDFERAGIKADAEGRVADLHALRTTLGTNLARAGVAPQIAQKLMRHGDYRTTLKSYTVLGLSDTTRAIEQLPGIIKEVSVATGTEGVAQTLARAARNDAIDGNSVQPASGAGIASAQKETPRGAGFSESMQRVAEVEPIGIEPTTSCMPCKRSPN